MDLKDFAKWKDLEKLSLIIFILSAWGWIGADVAISTNFPQLDSPLNDLPLGGLFSIGIIISAVLSTRAAKLKVIMAR